MFVWVPRAWFEGGVLDRCMAQGLTFAADLRAKVSSPGGLIQGGPSLGLRVYKHQPNSRRPEAWTHNNDTSWRPAMKHFLTQAPGAIGVAGAIGVVSLEILGCFFWSFCWCWVERWILMAKCLDALQAIAKAPCNVPTLRSSQGGPTPSTCGLEGWRVRSRRQGM